jgi:hypothetical protein
VFQLNLSHASGATIADSQGIGTILGYPADPTDGPYENGIQLLVTAPDYGSLVQVQVFDASEPGAAAEFSIDAYPTFGGGVRVATGDITGDGVPDIITGAGPSGGPHVRVWDGASRQEYGFGGLASNGFYAYAAAFPGGVFVAAADINGDGRDDIITGADTGGGPHVRVFDGTNLSLIMDRWAFDSTFTGGARVAAGDVNGDGRADVVAAQGPGGTSRVRLFSGADVHGAILYDFDAYGAFTGGAYPAVGDLNGDAKAEIVTGAGAGGGPHVKVFDGAAPAQQMSTFYPYDPTFPGGVRPAIGDVTGNGENAIITGPGPGGGAHVRTFGGNGDPLCQFFAYGPDMTQGVFVAGDPHQYTRPYAEDDVYVVKANAILSAPATGVLQNDFDEDGDTLTVTRVVSGPGSGMVSYLNSDGSFHYVPHSGFIGDDTFIYEISDGRSTDQATVYIRVENRAPYAVDDTFELPADPTAGITFSIGDLLFNDIDFDSDLLVVNSVGQAQEGGAITNHGDGTYTYYPPSNWDGYDQAEYVIADGFHTASARIEFVAWQGPGNLPDFAINLKVAAFIPLSKGNLVTWDVPPGEPYASLRWLPEPYQLSNITPWYFGTDDRDNFGAPGTSRLYSIGSFQASEIGSLQQRPGRIFATDSDDSHRVRTITAGGAITAYDNTKAHLDSTPRQSEIRIDGTTAIAS